MLTSCLLVLTPTYHLTINSMWSGYQTLKTQVLAENWNRGNASVSYRWSTMTEQVQATTPDP